MSNKPPQKGRPPPARPAVGRLTREMIRQLIEVMFAGKQMSLTATLADRLNTVVSDSTISRWVRTKEPTQPEPRYAEALWTLIEEMNTDQENKRKAEQTQRRAERRQWERERVVKIFLRKLRPNTEHTLTIGGALTRDMVEELGALIENDPDAKRFFQGLGVGEGDEE